MNTTSKPPDWRRPRGVAPGTWDYVHQSGIADQYDEFVVDTPLCKLDQTLVAEEIGNLAPSIVLDLGCGNGRMSVELLRRGHTVVGVDLSQRMLELMLEKAAAIDALQRVLAVRTNLVELGCIADESVDHAICMFSTLGMIQDRENRRLVLAHAARIVRPGGKLVLHVHHRWSAIWEPSGLRSLARSWIRSMLHSNHEFGDTTYEYRGLEDMFLHRFSRREIQQDVRVAGWNVDTTHAIALDGSHRLQGFIEQRFRAGGFFMVAKKTSAPT